MKTVAQVVKDYKAKMNAKDFQNVKVLEDRGDVTAYPNVTGLHNTEDENGKWLEFDYESFTFGKRVHVKLHGHVIKTIVPVE